MEELYCEMVRKLKTYVLRLGLSSPFTPAQGCNAEGFGV